MLARPAALPRFLAKCRYVKQHGALRQATPELQARDGPLPLPAPRYRSGRRGKNRARIGRDDEIEAKLKLCCPRTSARRSGTAITCKKGMTPSGRLPEEALTNMGCADRVDQIVSVVDLID